MEPVSIKLDLNFLQVVNLVKQLSPSEQLVLNEMIWEDQIEIPAEHQAIVTERIEKSRSNPERMINWDKVSETL
jgi:Putative addiction module component